jgi:hypothetical protein
MNYKEMMIFEKAIHAFFLKLVRKEEVEVSYVDYTGRNVRYDCAFTGYETNDRGGLFGIHYIKQKHQFFFGTLMPQIDDSLVGLSPAQELKIPSKLKAALYKVAISTRPMIIKKDKRNRTDVNMI